MIFYLCGKNFKNLLAPDYFEERIRSAIKIINQIRNFKEPGRLI